MRIPRQYIPRETDADVAMSVVIPNVNERTGCDVVYSYEFEGGADRTASGDVLSVDIKNKTNTSPSVKFSLKRDSIYHILPEYLFHPLDRYIGTKGDVAEFDKRYQEQEEQERYALTYFRFFDQNYQELKVKFQLWLNENIFEGNQFLSDFITNGYSFNKENPFVKASLPCIPWLRNHRGNKEMIEVALRCALGESAVVKYEWNDYKMELSSNVHSSLDRSADELYCGATFQTGYYLWHISYQTTIDTEAKLMELKMAMQEFSDFFKTWFLQMEEEIKIEFGDWNAFPVITDNSSTTGIFLNYSTQLI